MTRQSTCTLFIHKHFTVLINPFKWTTPGDQIKWLDSRSFQFQVGDLEGFHLSNSSKKKSKQTKLASSLTFFSKHTRQADVALTFTF